MSTIHLPYRLFGSFFLLLLFNTNGNAQDGGAVKPSGYVAPSANYVRSWDVIKPTTDPASITTATPISEARMTTQYFDGLGRPLQTVVKGGSLITPALGSSTLPSATDLVSPVVYDEYGREVRKFLPYAASSAAGPSSANGSFKLTPFDDQAAFYVGTTSPIAGQGYSMYYSKVEYEASPGHSVEIDHPISLEADHSVSLQSDHPFSLEVDHL